MPASLRRAAVAMGASASLVLAFAACSRGDTDQGANTTGNATASTTGLSGLAPEGAEADASNRAPTAAGAGGVSFGPDAADGPDRSTGAAGGGNTGGNGGAAGGGAAGGAGAGGGAQ